MARALGEMSIEDRNEFCAGVAPSETSLVPWYFVDEIEQKNSRMMSSIICTAVIHGACLDWFTRQTKLLIRLIGRIALRWAEQFEQDPVSLDQVDTSRLQEDYPVRCT